MSSWCRRPERGQSLVEFTLVMPMLIVLAFGLTEVGYALLDQHVVTKVTREGSNLISRDVTLEDAATAMQQMITRPVDFDNGSRLILSVLKKVGTTGSANYGHIVLYQRHEYGTLSAASKLTTAGTATFGGAPDYVAPNADNNTNLRVTNLPANIALVDGGMLYVTEVYTTHERLTPLDRFGVTMPDRLYAVAYF
jgi:hypothetical protein